MSVNCPWTLDGNKCTNTNTDASIPSSVLMNTQCDEKPTDWYTIENYHLGNRYVKSKAGDKCYAPCAPNYIPNYQQAVVVPDNLGSPDVSGIDTCASKNDWPVARNGAYRNTQDFCPLAVIKRISSTPASIKTDMMKTLSELNCNSQTPAIAEMEKDIEKQATKVNETLHKKIENIVNNSRNIDNVVNACNANLNTKERIEDAYKICSDLLKDPEKFIQNWEDAVPGTDEDRQKHIEVLRQACQASFCSGISKFNVKSQIPNKPDLCFTVRQVDTGLTTDKQGYSLGADDEDPKNGKFADPGASAVLYSINSIWAVLAVPVIVILVILLLMFWSRIKCLFSTTYNYLLTFPLYIIQKLLVGLLRVGIEPGEWSPDNTRIWFRPFKPCNVEKLKITA